MADRAIVELLEAIDIQPGDLLVVEQDGTAKKLSGQTLITFLTRLANGIGGFAAPLEKISTVGLVDTYQATYTNGQTSLLMVTNGEKGDTGAQTYVHIKYASVDPRNPPHSMGDQPDDWLGIYAGMSPTPPNLWSDYKWTLIKGTKGDTGSPATVQSQSIAYQVSASGTIPPGGSWVPTPPEVPQGQYLWSRSQVTFNTGSQQTTYGVSYAGRDGTGTVKTVAGVQADPEGDVPLTAASIGAATPQQINAANVIVYDLQIPASGFRTYTPSGEEETKLHGKGYTFRASVAVAGVLASMTPYVTLSLPDVEAAGVDIANQFSCYNGGIYVYADGQPGAAIAALTIECRKAVV